MLGNYSMDQREWNCSGAHTNFSVNTSIDNTLIAFSTLISVECVVIFAAVCGNSLVIIAFYKFSSLRTASNVILVSLCTANSLIVIALIINRDFKIQERGRRQRRPEVKINLCSSVRMTKSPDCRVFARHERDKCSFRVVDKT